MAFFRGSVDETAQALEGTLGARNISVNRTSLPTVLSVRALEAAMPSPEGPPCGILFASPSSPLWTCFVSPLEDGWFTLVNAACAHLPALEAVLVTDSDDEDKFPSRGFELFRGGRSIRKVHVWKDDGWQFVNRGEPLPFEDPSAYSQRVIAKRLTSAALSELLLHFEIDLWAIFDDAPVDARLLAT
jgi:hypothetical protein